MSGPGRRFGFSIRPIEEAPQSDPALMSPRQIREFVRGGGLPTVTALARRALAGMPERLGGGSWPEPLHQRGASCQTVAIINGIRCLQALTGTKVWNPGPEKVEKIRREAGAKYEKDGGTTYAAINVADYLIGKGRLVSRGVLALLLSDGMVEA